MPFSEAAGNWAQTFSTMVQSGASRGAHKKGAYCGDNHFPIKAIKGEYTHQYYTDFNTDSSLISTVKVKPHSGNTMIGLGQLYRTSIKEITGLKANTNYKLSIWIYQTNPCGFVRTIAVADNYDGVRTNGTTAQNKAMDIRRAPAASQADSKGHKKEEQQNQGLGQHRNPPLATLRRNSGYKKKPYRNSVRLYLVLCEGSSFLSPA